MLAGGDVLVHEGGWRVTRADVVVRAGRIQAVGGSGGQAEGAPKQVSVRDCTGCLVIPGLIQAHVHLCQTLFRGLAEEQPLLAWLRDRIWPLEAAHDPASLRASARVRVRRFQSNIE